MNIVVLHKKPAAMRIIRSLWIFLFIAGLFWSCSKEESGISLSGKIFRIVHNPGSVNADTIKFEYDGSGRVKTITRQLSVFNTIQTLTFERNSSGQITSVNERLPAAYYSNTLVNYSLGPDGKYISAHITLSHGSNPAQYEDVDYVYTGNRITQVNYHRAVDLNWRTNYSYDEYKNVTRIAKYDTSDSLLERYEYTTFDNKSTPVESVDDPYSIEATYLSGYNNPLTETDYVIIEGPIYLSHAYTYNDSGKPTTKITSMSYDSINYSQEHRTQYIYY